MKTLLKYFSTAAMMLAMLLTLTACPPDDNNNTIIEEPDPTPNPNTNPTTNDRSGVDNGHKYLDLSLPSGTLWAETNVGASKPEEYGTYFAWGETTQNSYFTSNDYKWCNGWDDEYRGLKDITKYCTYDYCGNVDNKTELDPEDDAATANWGTGWHMPSNEQIKELIKECTQVWTTINGVNGTLFTSKHNGVSLFLPAAGDRYSWKLENEGRQGFYWSRTLSGNPSEASMLYLDSTDAHAGNMYRFSGQSVRAVRVM